MTAELAVGMCIGFSLGLATANLVSGHLIDYLCFRLKLKAGIVRMQRDVAWAELRAQQIALLRQHQNEAARNEGMPQ